VDGAPPAADLATGSLTPGRELTTIRAMHHARRSCHSSARLFLLAAGLFLVTAGGALTSAQAPAAAKTVWDGVYTDAQADRATATFSTVCTNCHTLASTGNRPLSGERFIDKWSQRTAGDLLKFVSANMPNGNGGSLSPSAYNDLVALILKSNGFPAGATEVTPEAVASVQIVPKGGAGELAAGTLVRVVGCLAPKSGSDWVLTNATAPERADKAGPGAQDGSRALGDRTTTLKFVLNRLDGFVGQRMSVSGLLIGRGGVDGINVTTVNRVAETCP
jgi:quinoprotein glucose dehydrogenase